MIEQPLVSILIPVFNREKYLVNTLSTVLAQTYRNWKCIIIDDESIDNPMIRADFLQSSHIFSSRLKAGQDRDFYIKILIDQPKLKIIDYYGSVYNRH